MRPVLIGNLEEERPFYHRDPSTQHLNCARILSNDTDYIKEIAKKRVSYRDPDELPMDCDSIKRRSYFPSQPLSFEEMVFPVAYARIVYQDYRFLEMELAAAYSPQNYYCYAIDAKADAKFHDRIHSLARCFPNVVFTKNEYRVGSDGHNMLPSFLECLRLLIQLPAPWKYVVLLQNHDSTLRTNYETINIFKWLNGSNDVEVLPLPGGRIDAKLDWSFKSLNLFKNETRNSMGHDGFPPVLKFSKGYVEASLSRPVVDFLLNDLNLTELVARIEKGGYGIDEIMLPTLHASDAIGAPGAFTQYCQNEGVSVRQITRISLWDSAQCGSHNMRHSICVFGIEDIPRWLAWLPHLFGA
ncbi:Protein H41C03.3 [Aphelenchoides avenae]|nr:Protein H41C03.3 [Aphelenchus avenae]